MPEITLIEITLAFVEIGSEAEARGEKSSPPQMFARIKERHPSLSVALFFRAVLDALYPEITNHGAKAIVAKMSPEMQHELIDTVLTEFIERQIAELETEREQEAEIERTAAECEEEGR